MQLGNKWWCVTLLCLLSFAPVNGQRQAPPRAAAPPPRLTVGVIDEKGVEQPAVKKQKVSNLQRVQLRVRPVPTPL